MIVRSFPALIALLTTACSLSQPANQTTLRMRDGRLVQGELVAADAARQTVAVRVPPDWTVSVMGIPVGPDGTLHEVAVTEVAAIEHVEPWAIPAGWGLGGVGAVALIAGGIMFATDSTDSLEGAIGATTLVVLGTGLAIAGPIMALRAHLHEQDSIRLWNEAQGHSLP